MQVQISPLQQRSLTDIASRPETVNSFEIEGKTPPEHCERGGPSKAKTKAELVKYLRDSFDYGDHVLATITAQNALDRVEGPYAGPNTRLGIAVAAVWHITDHYGQLVIYLRLNGIVPPVTQQYPLKVR